MATSRIVFYDSPNAPRDWGWCKLRNVSYLDALRHVGLFWRERRDFGMVVESQKFTAP